MTGLDSVVLEGQIVRLEPLRRSHLDALCAAGCDPALWAITVHNGGTPALMKQWLEQALVDLNHGSALPFATILRANEQLIGSTRFGNIDHKNKRVEIGWTWLGKSWQRTGANRDSKLLMLRHAFDTWHCRRVEFKTDAINQTSRRALLGIGAKEEGTLRKHQQTWTGRVRDTVYYSIVDDEWPAVRQRLESLLQGGPRC